MEETANRMNALEVEGSTSVMQNPMMASGNGDDSDSSSSSSSDDEGGGHNNPLDPSVEFMKRATCCKVFGCRGTFYLLLMLAAGGLHFTIFYFVTHNGVRPFARMDGDYAWVFLLFASLFALMFFRGMLPCYWRKFVRRAYIGQRRMLEHRSKSKNSFVKIYNKYQDTFGLNGTFYLWRLHIFEFMENYVSVYNIKVLYLCSLPHIVCIIFMVLLILESTYRAYSMAGYLWRGAHVSKRKRDLQITIDILVDMTFLIFPFAVSWLMYKVSFSIREILLIVLMPSISLFSKLRKMLQENIEDNIDKIASGVEAEISFKQHHRRKSLFGESRTEHVEAMQGRYFPRCAKLAVFSLSIIFVVTLVVIGAVQLAVVSQLENKCECFVSPACEQNMTLSGSKKAPTNLFSTGCRIKAPFCSNLFVPKCNCVAFELESHSIKVLSEKFVELTALRRIELTHGPLRELPKHMERLGQINRFDVSFNRLERFGVDVEKWGQLLKLKLQFNNITDVHKSVWKHETMVYLYANSNRGLQLPNGEGTIFMPSLYMLDLVNNSALLPGTLGPDELPRLGSIAFDGNKLRNDVFPKEFEQLLNTVQILRISNLGLRYLPKFLPSFHKLGVLDARNNSISNVSNAMSTYFESQGQSAFGFELHLSGNPGCTGTLPVSACTPLCSEYCQSRSYLKDGECDAGCNSQDCHFDGGDCEV